MFHRVNDEVQKFGNFYSIFLCVQRFLNTVLYFEKQILRTIVLLQNC